MSLGLVIEELDRFREQLSSNQNESLDLTLERYVSFRRTVARLVRDHARKQLADHSKELDKIFAAIGRAMGAFDDGSIPPKYLVPSPYGQTHSDLLGYLVRHLGSPVSGSKLRVITGDQIHTERRLRELRNMGLDLTSERVFNDDQYVLRGLDVDLGRAAAAQIVRNIRDDRSLSKVERSKLIERVLRHPLIAERIE